MANYVLVTNNPECQKRYGGEMTVEYQEDWSYLDVLYRVKEQIARGLVLITHPLAGSLRPNQTPYRSVILADRTIEDKTPQEDIFLIKNSIETCKKFFRCRTLPDYPPSLRKDFRTLELSFLEGAMAHARQQP